MAAAVAVCMRSKPADRTLHFQGRTNCPAADVEAATPLFLGRLVLRTQPVSERASYRQRGLHTRTVKRAQQRRAGSRR